MAFYDDLSEGSSLSDEDYSYLDDMDLSMLEGDDLSWLDDVNFSGGDVYLGENPFLTELLGPKFSYVDLDTGETVTVDGENFNPRDYLPRGDSINYAELSPNHLPPEDYVGDPEIDYSTVTDPAALRKGEPDMWTSVQNFLDSKFGKAAAGALTQYMKVRARNNTADAAANLAQKGTPQSKEFLSGLTPSGALGAVSGAIGAAPQQRSLQGLVG